MPSHTPCEKAAYAICKATFRNCSCAKRPGRSGACDTMLAVVSEVASSLGIDGHQLDAIQTGAKVSVRRPK